MNKSVIASICQTTADYRADEGLQPTPDRVARWVRQFDEAVRDDLLAELDHVLKNTYISKANVDQFLSRCATSDKLTGGSPKKFWENVGLLDLQTNSRSQKHMIDLISETLLNELNICPPNTHSNISTFIYLDDGIFSGNRTVFDLSKWIENSAPDIAELHIIVQFLIYRNG